MSRPEKKKTKIECIISQLKRCNTVDSDLLLFNLAFKIGEATHELNGKNILLRLLLKEIDK